MAIHGGVVTLKQITISENWATNAVSAILVYMFQSPHYIQSPLDTSGCKTRARICSRCAQGGGMYIDGGTISIISSQIGPNFALDVRTVTSGSYPSPPWIAKLRINHCSFLPS